MFKDLYKTLRQEQSLKYDKYIIYELKNIYVSVCILYYE
jgi:hypothetical protein